MDPEHAGEDVDADAEEPEEVTLFADVHEPLDVVDAVAARGVPVVRRKLHPADYVVGAVAVERKTVGDFFASLTRKRLFEQVVRLKETYPQPVLLLEGDLSAVNASFSQPSTFWGALASIAVDVGVPVLPAPSKAETVELLARLHARVARGLAGGGSATADVRFKPRALDPAAELKFAVQGLPKVGDVQSERMLERFGTVRRVFAASERELTRVPGLGKVKARAITEFLNRPFKGRQQRLSDGAEKSEEE